MSAAEVPETREVCTSCGQVGSEHLQKCKIAELTGEVERLREERDSFQRAGIASAQRAAKMERKLAEAMAALRYWLKQCEEADTDESARVYLEARLWSSGARCPIC